MGAIGCTTPLKDGPHRLELPNGELAVQQIPAAPVLPPTATIKDTTLLQRQHGGLKRGKWGTGTSSRLGRSSCSPPARRLRRTRTFFLWNDGAVSKVAAAGDPAPGGGSFWAIGTERIGFVDGTTMPTGPLGAINDVGLISFRGYVTGGEALAGIFRSDGKTHEWYVRHGDPTPMGGTYADFAAPSLNNAGQVAFFADVSIGSTLTSGWFAGSPDDWRKAIAFYECGGRRPGNWPGLFSQSFDSAERLRPLVALGDPPDNWRRPRAAFDQRARRKPLDRRSAGGCNAFRWPNRKHSSLAIAEQRRARDGLRGDARRAGGLQRVRDLPAMSALIETTSGGTLSLTWRRPRVACRR